MDSLRRRARILMWLVTVPFTLLAHHENDPADLDGSAPEQADEA